MSRDRDSLVFLFAFVFNASCSSGGASSAPQPDGGEKGDATRDGADASAPPADGSSELPDPDASQDGQAAPDGATPDLGDGGPSCDLSMRSVLLHPVIHYTSGTDPTECPSDSNGNIVGASCSLEPAGGCIANATCSVAFRNAGSGAIITETGAVTLNGSTASGAISWQDPSGITCNQSIAGNVTIGTGTPGACSQTCANMTPNDEKGCNPCLMTACPAAYQACVADNVSGCIGCSQLLGGTAGSGVQCANTDQLVFNLLACGCSSAACD